jgi:non-ribosomal peptide synthetase component F
MDTTDVPTGLEGLSSDDREQFWQYGRGPSVNVSHNIAHLAFERMVDLEPSAYAAKHGDDIITYRELDAAANRMANYLVEVGLTPKKRVCLVVEESFAMFVGMLAILKTGCQFVLIDGDAAVDRTLCHILKNTGTRFILCSPKFEERAKQNMQKYTRVVCLGAQEDAFASNKRPGIPVAIDDGVYAIYSSGTSLYQLLLWFPSPWLTSCSEKDEIPKGIDATHQNVTSTVFPETSRMGISRGSKVAYGLKVSSDIGMPPSLFGRLRH